MLDANPISSASIPSAAWFSTKSILSRYRTAPRFTRFFLLIRWLWTPYVSMAALLPARGTILDVGCGHGLLSLALALGSSARKVKGSDHDEERVRLARLASKDVSNLEFSESDFSILLDSSRKSQLKEVDGIALIDVLHYFSFEDQKKILTSSFDRLCAGGVLIFREVNPNAGLVSKINRLHEKIMTSFGFTKAEQLHFREVGGWEVLAREAGFHVRSMPFGNFPFADVLFVCTRNS